MHALRIMGSDRQPKHYPVSWFQLDGTGATGDRNTVTNIFVNINGTDYKLHYFGSGTHDFSDAVGKTVGDKLGAIASTIYSGFSTFQRWIKTNRVTPNMYLQGAVVLVNVGDFWKSFVTHWNQKGDEGYYDSTKHDHQHLIISGRLTASQIVEIADR